MKLRIIVYCMFVAVFMASSCEQLKGKLNKSTDPIDVIETLSNDVSKNGDDWTKEDWEDVADEIENALDNLPARMTKDEETIVDSSIARMKVYAERHRRKASEFLDVLNKYRPEKSEKDSDQLVESQPVETDEPRAVESKAPQPVETETPQPVEAEAPRPVQVATPQPVASAPPVAGLMPAHVIREGGYTNVRQGPGTNYNIVTKVKDGNQIYYTYYNKNWCRVYNTQGQLLGFMHSSKVIPSGTPVASSSSPRIATGTKFDWLAKRYATEADIQYCDASQLRILRNSIYARHGYRFNDAGLRKYFNAQQWYDGYRSVIPESEFNKYEKYNINFIKRYE